MQIKTLFVDDERSLLEQAEIFIERMDDELDVYTSTSAAEALHIMDEKNFDVIVSDYQMPEINGLEFLEKVREERDSDIPFIMFTGKGREEVAMKALNLGADRYIQKGGNPKSQYGVLVQAIKQEVEHHRTEKELEKSEKREKLFSSSLEGASLEVFWVTPEGEFVFANETARDRLGYSEDELKGMHVWDIDPNYPKEKRKEFWEELKRRGKQNFVTSHMKDDGEIYPVEISSQYIEHDGEEYEFAFAKDITEREERKNELHERVKELECLYSISNLTQGEELSIESTMKEVVEIIPRGFAYPKNTSAKIIFDDQVYESNDFEESSNSISEELSTDHGSGRVEVHVDKEKDGEDVFLEQEKDLLSSITIHLENSIERKMKVEEIEELSKFQEALIEDSNVWLNVTDEEGNILVWNKGAEEISGYKAEEVEGNDKIWEWLYPDEEYRKEIMERFSGIFSEKEVSNLETEIECKKGEKKIISWNSRVWKDDEENVTGTIALGRDVTKQKEVEHELKYEKNRYETLFEQNPEAVVEVDEDFRVVRVNTRFERLFHFEEKEIKGEHIDDLLVPEEKIEEAKELDERTQKDGRFDYETVRLTKSGEEIPVFITGRTIHQDEGTHHLAVYRDITEQKETEERIRKNKEKIENLHKISTELETCENEEQVYEHAVKTAERILEFDICAINAPEGNFMKATAISSRFPDGASSVDKPLPIDDSLAGKTYRENRSFLVKDKEDNEYVNPTTDKFISGISVPIGDFAVFQAVSTVKDDFDDEDLRMVELLMDHVSEALKRVKVKEREDFLHSLLRHDVRNKNQIIKGYLELMKDCDLSKEANDFIEKAEHAAEDSIDIIEKVRKLRKIEEEEEIEKIDMSLVFDKILSEHQGQLKENDININISRCDCKVKGGKLLEELFSNLIENSIQHSRCDEIKISSLIEDDECVVCVEDDGVGIDDEVKEKIFKKGFKKGETAGTGLGLYMVKEIAESYDGSVEVKDSSLGGAKFVIHLFREKISDDPIP